MPVLNDITVRRARPRATKHEITSHTYTKAIDWQALPRDHPKPTRAIRFYRERRRERFLTPEERAHLEQVLRRAETLPASSHVSALLEELRERRAREIPWVIHTRSGRPSHGATLSKSWRTLRSHPGLDDVRLHDLRRSAASDALMAESRSRSWRRSSGARRRR